MVKKDTYPVATFDVDFSADRDWTNLVADSNGIKAVLHYDDGFTSLPGQSGDSFSLYIPDQGGTRVRICPDAATLAEVTSGCSNEYFLTEANGNVTKSTVDDTNYWIVSGLSGTGGEDGGDESSGSPASTTHAAPVFTNLTFYLTLALTTLGGVPDY